MANEHYEHAIQGLPCRVSSTALLIYGVIAYRFDKRPFLPNGKPNPGHNKSYPGEKSLVSATGKSRQAVNKALKELIDNGLIVRVTIGKPGQRAEYVPIYTTNALGISVNNALHKSKVYKPRKVADNVNNASTMSKQGLPNKATKVYSISTISNHKYGKYNQERFDFIISGQTKQVQDLIEPGKNIEHLLDLLEGKRMSREQIKEAITRIDFTNAHSVGGLFNSVLKHLAGLTSATKSPYAKSSPNVDKYEQKQPPAFNPELDSFANNFGLPPG